MSLNGALQVGRTALATSQAALQVAGNNMANAATEGFHRRSVHLSPLPGEIVGRGHLIGRGVQIDTIRREVDTALEARFRDALSDESAALTEQGLLTTAEALQNELTGNDLSSMLSDFFNSFSELGNAPADDAVRAVVIQQGIGIASRIADLRSDYDVMLGQVDDKLGAVVTAANDLLGQIETINAKIAASENGVGEAAALRDQRDLLINELSGHLELTVIEQPSGAVDILVNSTPIMLAGESRGLELRFESVNGASRVSLRVAADGTELQPESGTLGALLRQRESGAVTPMIQTLDDFAAQLIFQVNRVHSQGQGERGFEAVTGTYAANDTTVNLNQANSGLPYRIENGSFFVHVTHQDTGQRTTHQINVDGDAMSLDDLINEINVVVGAPNVTAGLSVESALTLTASAGYEFSFSDDTSGALAALGVNTFFAGEDARSITINGVLENDPSRLAAGVDHIPGSNGTALAIADLQDVPVSDLNGLSLRSFWQNAVNDLAVQTDSANNAAESASLVRDSLFAQIQAISGVSLDEESINLLTFQRQYQAAARFITVIDEALQILISIA